MARMDIRHVEFEDVNAPRPGDDEGSPEDRNADHGHGEDERTDEEFERQARADGWLPPEELAARDARTGRTSSRPPMTAREFVERGESILPIVNAKNRELRKQVERQERRIEELSRSAEDQKAAIEAAMNLARTAGERGYKRALADLEAKRDAAVEVGDSTAVRQTQEEIDTLREERRAAEAPPVSRAAPPPAAGAVPPAMDPDIHAFIERPENAWFKSDQTLREAMMAHHQLVRTRTPGLSMAEQLQRARAALVDDFPESFSQTRRAPPRQSEGPNVGEYDDEPPPPRRPAAAPVMRPGERSPRDAPARSPFERIADPAERAEARAAFAQLQRGDPNASAKEYVDIYLEPKSDMLSIIAQRKK